MSLLEVPVPAGIAWRSADGSTQVDMPAEIVDRIAGYVVEAYKAVPRRGAETGGLLVGQVRLGPVTAMTVTGFEPVRCEHRFGPSFVLSDADDAEFRAALSRHPGAEVLGYYRSHTRKDFGIENSDHDIIERFFPGRSGIALIIKPSSIAALTGEFFFFQGGRLEAEPAGEQFRFQGSVPGGTHPPEAVEERIESTAVRATEAVHATSMRRRKRLQWEIVAAACMIAAALGLLYWQYRGADAVDAGPVSHAAASQVASLGLAVEPGESGWRVTWDSQSGKARDAVRGVLNVVEDNSQERVPLSAAAIQSGSTTYKPIGDDITFRLELIGRDNSTSSETYRIVRKAPVVVRSVPPETPKSEEPYVAPEVLHKVSPEVGEGIRPRIASPLPIDVRVHIDRTGHVTSATAVQHGDGLTDYLAERAVYAAKLWTFTPAKKGSRQVESSQTIHFIFEQ